MKTEIYGNYGKCVRFERGGTKVLVTLDLGPRIIWFGTAETNFLNEDRERNVDKGGEYFDLRFGKGTKWYLYGGHRVWKSPEDLETYVPDNVPVEADVREYGGTFTCRVALNLDYTLDLDLDEDGRLTVKDIVTNKGEARTLAVWGLTVMAKGGVMVMPTNEPKDELNPVQNLVFWPYDAPDDDRLSSTRKRIALKWADNPDAIKIGTFTKRGEAYYVLGDKAMKWECAPEEGIYGDFWCNFESYTNNHILEVEWLSPLRNLEKGESATLTERWSLTEPPVDLLV